MKYLYFLGVPRDLNEPDKKSNGETILILPGLHENPFHGDSFQPSFSFSDITDDDDSDEDSFGHHPFRFNFDSSSFFKRMQGLCLFSFYYYYYINQQLMSLI